MATPDDKTNATTPATGVDEVKQLKEELKQRDEAIADLTQKVSDLQGTIISPQYQEFLNAQKQPPTFQATDFAAGRTGEVDLEMMTNEQLIGHIMGEFDKRFTPRIEQVSQNVRQDQLHRGIKEAKGRYKDFDNYKVAMGKTAARLESGNITADDVYKIESWKPQAETDNKDKGTIASEKPTGAVDAPTDTKKMTLAEKVSKKWDEMGIDEKHPRAQD